MVNLPAVVVLPDEGELGPAMRALPSDRMRRFVIAMTENAATGVETSKTRAAKDAGYGGGIETLRSLGSKLAHDERIISAIREEGHRRLGSALPLAVGALVNLLADNDKKIQLQAIKMVLNRAGIPEVTEQKMTVEHLENEGQKIDRIIMLAKALNLDPRTLLGRAADGLPQLGPADSASAVEAEFTVVAENPHGF
jgi:phage terminase small subunit